MLIDEDEIATPSGEACKRRMLGIGVGGDLETTRIVDGVVKGSIALLKKAEVASQPRLTQ